MIFAAFPPKSLGRVTPLQLQPPAHPGPTIGSVSLSGTAFRFQISKDGSEVRLYSKSGVDYSNTLPSMRKAFAELPTNSAILDGELCLIDPGDGANSYRLMRQMRTWWPEQLRAPGLRWALR